MQKQSKISWKCPSNIALVKYWGKYGRQLPKNPSISFTLNNAHTVTTVEYSYSEIASNNIRLEFLFEGKQNQAFQNKISDFLSSIKDVYPLIDHLKLKIESSNSFPHSSGIASSASSMSALAMCLVDIEKDILELKEIDLRKASFLARLGSGSASRSIFPQFAVWGECLPVKDSSNEYAVPYIEGIDPVFLNFRDDILIVSKDQKSVSSRAGHALMENNPYAETRFTQAKSNMDSIIKAMRSGDLDSFGRIVEREALSLHALMMSSDPPYILLEPNTIAAIKSIQAFRIERNIPVYFTLDAGPNIHMLYPESSIDDVSVLKEELRDYCFEKTIIEDHVGMGPQKLI